MAGNTPTYGNRHRTDPNQTDAKAPHNAGPNEGPCRDVTEIAKPGRVEGRDCRGEPNYGRQEHRHHTMMQGGVTQHGNLGSRNGTAWLLVREIDLRVC
jgi:hypothetical protein